MIATLARRGEERGLDVFIVTADKDARQLIGDHVRHPQPPQQEGDGRRRPREGLGHPPRPGRRLPGPDRRLGRQRPGRAAASARSTPRRSSRSSARSTTCSPIAERVKGPKKQQSLRDHAETARLARRLVALRDDLPLETRLGRPQDPAARPRGPAGDLHRVRLPRVPRRAGTARRGETAEAGPPWVADYRLVDTPESFAAFLDELRQQPRFCIDTETTALDPLRAELVGPVVLAGRRARPITCRCAGRPDRDVLDAATTLAALRPILADPAVEKVGQNVKYDMLALARRGRRAGRADHRHDDPQLPARERRAEPQPRPALAAAARPRDDPDHRPDRQGEEPAAAWTRSTSPKVAEYAGEDADATWRIEAILAPKVASRGALGPLRRPGAAVDLGPGADGAGRHRGGRRRGCGSSRRSSPSGWRAIEAEIYQLAGRPFNINSPPQLRQVLFDELKLPSLQKTPGGEPSTAQDVLEELALKHPLPALLLRHRQLAKLKGTYLDALPDLVHPERRPDPRLVQPGGRGDRPAQLERPEPPEHPGAHRGGPADPPGVRARAGRAGSC